MKSKGLLCSYRCRSSRLKKLTDEDEKLAIELYRDFGFGAPTIAKMLGLKKFRPVSWLMVKNGIIDSKRRNAWNKGKTVDRRLVVSLRRRVAKAIRKFKKSARTMELVGCSLDELKLQQQFRDGMTWENWGVWGWHIDHKIPCAHFDLSKADEQRKCFHFSNLQPLWCHENQSKGSRRISL